MSGVIEMPEPVGMSPAERTLWMVRTRPEVLDEMAWNLWYNASDYFPNGVRARAAWDATSEHDKQPWRDRAMVEIEEFVAMTDAQRTAVNRVALNAQMLRNGRADRADSDHRRETEQRSRENQAAAIRRLENAVAKRQRKAGRNKPTPNTET